MLIKRNLNKLSNRLTNYYNLNKIGFDILNSSLTNKI